MSKEVLKLIMQVKMLIALLNDGASIYNEEVVHSVNELERLINDVQSAN